MRLAPLNSQPNGSPARSSDRKLRRPITSYKVAAITLAMGLLLVIVGLWSLLTGTARVPAIALWNLVSGMGAVDETARLILWEIRLPRVLLAGLVGYTLSLGGVVFQALLRNPLADPFILGVSSGAAFGAIVGIMLGLGFGFGIPMLAFGGALLSLLLLLALGARTMGVESSTILLTGVIINAFFSAIIMFFVSTAADAKLHSMLFWLYGDLSQSHLRNYYLIGAVLVAATVVVYAFAGRLNLIIAGEETAAQLGVDVAATKYVLLLVVSVAVGTVVAFAGLIGFVGLIVPHLARMLFGSDHRLLIPVAALGGASFLIVADALARVVISPSELPVGVICAFVGAPFFVYLLRKKGSQWSRL